MGIFGRNIDVAYGPTGAVPLAINSPWSPQDSLVTFAVDDALADVLKSKALPMTREIAGRIPGVQRAHGVHVSMFAEIPFFQYQGDERTKDQPRWLTTSDSGVAPYHRMYGLGSDLFYNGWGCLSFTADMSDCMHVPFGMWQVLEDRKVWVDPDHIPAPYRARPVAIPLGYGSNGLLNDAVDTLTGARNVERAYQDRLANPIPLTVLSVPYETWKTWGKDERRKYREAYIEARKAGDGSVAMKVQEWGFDMPGQIAVDLYESGRNAARLDIANHTHTPADMLEGAKQGGSGGTEMNYNGVQNGATRSDLWDFGLAKRFMRAFEARMSLDDVVGPGLSIRGDRSYQVAAPTPGVGPTSED